MKFFNKTILANKKVQKRFVNQTGTMCPKSELIQISDCYCYLFSFSNWLLLLAKEQLCFNWLKEITNVK